MADTHIGQMVQDHGAKHPSGAAFRVRKGDAYEDVLWSEVLPRMRHIGAGLLTAHELADDAHIAIIGNTSMDWVIADFAALAIGLRTVPVYASLLPEEVGYMHCDTNAVLAIVENGDQLDKVRKMQEGFQFFGRDYAPADVPLQHIVVIDATGVAPADDWESLAELEARGKERLAEVEADMDRRTAQIARDQTATYTYTSGTTGAQKAVIQTHENMLSMLEAAHATGMFTADVQRGGLFLFLPLAHSFGRLIELSGPFFDSPLVISSVPTLVEDLQLSKPGFFPSAPRVYEKMKAKIDGGVAGAPAVRRALFRWAVNAGKATIPYRSVGKPVPLHLRLQAKLADRLVGSKVRARLGLEKSGLLLSGSAPLSVEVHEFFLAIGLNLMEAYGLTETCPGLTTNLSHSFKLGTVGQAFPGVDLKIAEDGEILAKGPNITSGYLNRDEATNAAFDDEGWFHTGDLGSLDGQGFLKITGRKKELIKTSGGKYVAPTKIEGRIKGHPIIQEAVVIGDRRKYCVCLVAVDPEELVTWAAQNSVEADATSAAVRDAIQAHIDEVNQGLASFETMKMFRVLPEPVTVENGILTASLKVKRKVVEERYAALIEEMYAGA